LVGALVAVGFAETVSQDRFFQAQGGRNIVQPGYNAGSSLGIEVLTTAILVFVALSFADRRRGRGSAGFGPFVLGLVVLVVHLIALPINGASMNPTRSFASSALYHQWDYQWTYWVGPALGAIGAAVIYEVFLRDKTAARERYGYRHANRDSYDY